MTEEKFADLVVQLTAQGHRPPTSDQVLVVLAWVQQLFAQQKVTNQNLHDLGIAAFNAH